MKRSLSFALVPAGTTLIAGTYGLVRLAFGLFLPDIRADTGLGVAAAGYVSTGASVAYCVGALVGLAAPDRPRLLVLGAFGTAGVGALGMACAPGAVALVPATVLASTGAGLASPGLVGVVARSVTSARVAAAQATVNAGTGPGLIAAGVLALMIPWRAAFVLAAAVTIVAGLAVLVLDRGGEPSRVAPVRPGRVLVVPAVAALLLGAASAVVWTYGRSHLVDAGAGTRASVIAWVAVGVGGTASVLTAHALGALPPSQAWFVSTGTVAVAIVALGLAPQVLLLAVAACGLFGWGFVAASSALIAWVTDLEPHGAAAGTSLLFIALVLGQAGGSAAAGALTGPIGTGATFVLAAAVALVAASASGAPRYGRGHGADHRDHHAGRRRRGLPHR